MRDANEAVVQKLQEKQAELMRLLRAQQQELEEVRKQQLNLQELVSTLGNTGEMGLQNLVVDLKRLLQETSNELCGSNAKDLLDNVGGTSRMLQELREERGLVADMLEGVRREKCEVIAMMHTFAMDKGEAMQELEGFRRSTREDVMAILDAARQDSSCLLPKENSFQYPFEAVASPADINNNASSCCWQSSPLQGRHPSRPNLSLSSTMVPPGVGSRVAVSVPQPAQVAQVLGGGSVQATGFLMSSSSPLVNAPGPEMHQADGGRKARSPVRQYSASVQTVPGQALMPVSIACSPSVVTRATTIDLVRSGKQLPVGDRKQSPLRRFISAGVTPRTAHHQDGAASQGSCHGQGWSTSSWANVSTSPIVISRS